MIYFSYGIEDEVGRSLFFSLRCDLRKMDIRDYWSERENISFDGNLDNTVLDFINNCSLFIQIFRPNSPNLLFELGYAIGRNKKILIIAGERDLPPIFKKLPFISIDSEKMTVLENINKYINDANIFPESSPRLEFDINFYDSICESPDEIDKLDPYDLELLSFNLLNLLDFKVEKCSSERGFDFYCSHKSTDFALELKKYRYSNRIGVSQIRQFYGAIKLEGIKFGVFVSTCPFSPSALDFAKRTDGEILLWSFSKMVKGLTQLQKGNLIESRILTS